MADFAVNIDGLKFCSKCGDMSTKCIQTCGNGRIFCPKCFAKMKEYTIVRNPLIISKTVMDDVRAAVKCKRYTMWALYGITCDDGIHFDVAVRFRDDESGRPVPGGPDMIAAAARYLMDHNATATLITVNEIADPLSDDNLAQIARARSDTVILMQTNGTDNMVAVCKSKKNEYMAVIST